MILGGFYLYWKSTHNLNITAYMVSAMMAINAIITLILAYGLHTRFRRSVFIATNIFIWVNIFLTVTDQFGIWDLASLIIDTAIVISLYLNRKLFLKRHA